MPKGKRRKVSCGLCKAVFDSDYASTHFKRKHSNHKGGKLPIRDIKQATLFDNLRPGKSSMSKESTSSQLPPTFSVQESDGTTQKTACDSGDNLVSAESTSERSPATKARDSEEIDFAGTLPETGCSPTANRPVSPAVSTHEEHQGHGFDISLPGECMEVELETVECVEVCHAPEPGDNEGDETSESLDDDATDAGTEEIPWIECYGRLRHLGSLLVECQDVVARGEATLVPNPKHMIGDAIDIVERVNSLSTDLLNDCRAEMKKLEEVTHHNRPPQDQAEFTPVERDPAERRRIETDNDRANVIAQGPFQPTFSRYPRNTDIDVVKQCQFSSGWFKDYPHLEYSIKDDSAYCFVCQIFPQRETNPAWVTNGVRSWDKMKSRGRGKKGKLASHFGSTSHCRALEQLANFDNLSSHVDLQLNQNKRKQMIEEVTESIRNREAIKVLLDISRTLARQGIAFRGSSDENEGSSNFKQMTNLISRHCPTFRRWLDDAVHRPHGATYLGPSSQNEFIKLLAEDVSSRILFEVEEAGMYSIIADTTPDVSHVDQLSVVARYVDDSGEAKERLVDMREINDKTGDGHAQAILSAIDSRSLDRNGVSFQSYDYTSSMSGTFKGCQAKMKEYLNRDIPYIPCMAHRINTTVEHSCEASKAVCDLFDILQELFVFFTSSTKRYDVYREKMEGSDDRGLLLRNLSVTRWSAREESIRAVWTSYDTILDALEQLTAQNHDSKTRVKATALMGRMRSFNFIVTIMFMKSIMGKTKHLTTEVQTTDINIVDTLDSMKAAIATLEHIRNDDGNMDALIDAAKAFAEARDIDYNAEFGRHHRPRKLPRRLDERPNNETEFTLATYYRKEFITVLDSQISELNANMTAVTDILQPFIRLLCPPYTDGIDSDDVAQMCAFFPDSMRPDDPDAVEAELFSFRSHVNKNLSNINTAKDAKTYVNAHVCRDTVIFPLTKRCLNLMTTVPITSASSERSFSKLKLVKTFLRSVMGQDRLHDLLILACERDLTDCVDLDAIVDRWAHLPKCGRLIGV